MKKRMAVCLAVWLLCLSCLTGCSSPVGDGGGAFSENDSEPIPDFTDEPTKEERPIFADLNHDGVEDQIRLVFGAEETSSVTLKVVDGETGAELMAETITLHSTQTTAYYLKLGKGNALDALFTWSYCYETEEKLTFQFSEFSFDRQGKLQKGDHLKKKFALSPEAAVAKGNYEFRTMLKALGEHIWASTDFYDAFLLLDNRNNAFTYSTWDKMVLPSPVEFDLRDFVKESD